MSAEIRLLDVVALTTDVPDAHLSRDERGTVVEYLAPGVFEVEFVNDEGQTYACLPLRAEQLSVVFKLPAQSREAASGRQGSE